MSSVEQLQNDLLAMLSTGLKKNVQMSDNVFDLGADSLDLQTVMEQMNQKYGIRLKTKEMLSRPYAEDMIEFVISKINDKI